MLSVYSLQPLSESLTHFPTDVCFESAKTSGCWFSAAANSPVEVVGNVDVALGSGQQEHDEGII